MASSLWSPVDGGITAPAGFCAAGIKAGLKASGKPDLALLLAPEGAVCAGTFTQSEARAACIDLCIDRLNLSSGRARAVLINSGHANACTGDRGLIDSLRATQAVADVLGLSAEEVLISSTGVIGVPIEMSRLLPAIEPLVEALNPEGGLAAAKAILTTDLVEKQIALQADLGEHSVCIGGMAKGSGMIHPNMATMLGFISCDVGIPLEIWQGMIKRVVDRSFNSISVDGDTSTNDSLLAFAYGTPLESQYWNDLEAGLTVLSQHLARAISRDGEGATCLFEVQIEGAENNVCAKKMARVISSSSLVKTAIHGCDPNWGRIVAAAGRSGVSFQLEALSLWMGPYQVIQGGQPIPFDRDEVSTYIRHRIEGSYLLDDCVSIRLVVGLGNGTGIAWGCDLSQQYVHINADYTT